MLGRALLIKSNASIEVLECNLFLSCVEARVLVSDKPPIWNFRKFETAR
jgi:hypothetical protein